MHLYKASDAEDSYAVSLNTDLPGTWRAQRGYGAAFQKMWSIEVQSEVIPDLNQVDWDAILVRAVEAYDLNDPLIVGFSWPLREPA